MSTNFVQKGCEFIKRAVQKDNEEKYAEAVSLYANGIQYLLTGLKYEKNQRVQTAIKEKVQKYLTRAEDINSALKKKKRKKKKRYKYPTQQQINEAINDTNEQTIHLIHGYARSVENILNIHYCIPDGIVKLCLVYYYIPITYTPDPKKHIVFEKPNIKWDDVAGLTNAKQNVKEFVILPLKFPALFTSIKRKKQWNVLLYGPPGTGKTFLSKAIANETNNATFFSVSSCDLCSKYYGDAEIMLRNIFAMARDKKPSIICFDEIDSIFPSRRGSSDHPRRIVTEFLIQLQNSCSDSQIVVIGITNCPWNLTPAARRRFTKRIYIPLPDQVAREEMFRIHIGNVQHNLSDEDFINLGQMTGGYSGSDISGIVQDTMMEPVRNLQNATHFKRVANQDDDYKLMACNANENGAIQMRLIDIAEHEHNKIMVEPLEMKHFLMILERSKASVTTEDIERYINWRNEFEEEE